MSTAIKNALKKTAEQASKKKSPAPASIRVATRRLVKKILAKLDYQTLDGEVLPEMTSEQERACKFVISAWNAVSKEKEADKVPVPSVSLAELDDKDLEKLLKMGERYDD